MSEMNLRKKLSSIRNTISITKNGKNDYGGYTYYQLDDIYAAIKQEFDKQGIFTSIEQNPAWDTKTPTLVYTNKDKDPEIIMCETPLVKTTLTVYDTESDEEIEFSNVSEMNRGKGMQPAQNAGANITYQTKYAYAALLMLDDGGDDIDNDKHKPTTISANTDI